MRHGPSWSLWTAIAAITVSGATGCSDQIVSAPPSAPSSAFYTSTAVGSDDPVGVTERASARLVARALAQALRDPGARGELKRALASSHVPELKLHLASYLTGRGGPILAAAAREAGVDGASVRQALGSVRDLELYMPVPSHRGDWTGSQTPLVAFALREDEPPEAYDSLGRSRLLNRMFPPAEPVIILAPAEGNFRQQQPANLRGEPETDCVPGPNESLAGAARRCGNDGRTDRSERPLDIPMPTCEATGASCYPGIVLNELHLSSDECGAECWAWGDPEYQLHVYGKKLSSDTKGYDLQCSGDGAMPYNPLDQPGASSPAYVFDMNGRNWSGNALVFSSGQFTSLRAVDSVFVLQLWEDDSNYCINTGASLSVSLNVASAFFGGAMGAIAWSARDENSWVAGAFAALAAFAAWNTLGDVLNGGDDFVGGLVEKTHTAFSYGENAGRNTVIVRGGSYKGFANIGWRTGPTTPGSVASVAISDASPKVPLGYSKKLEAFAYDQAGFSISGLAVTWQSSNSGVASVDNTGLVTGNSLGTATITATISGVQGSVVVSVLNIGGAVSITVTPGTVGGPPGNTMQLVAHLYDSNGFELPTTGGYNWSSDAPTICSVDGNGLVTAVAGGTTTVRVTNEGLTATASCTVSFGGQWMVVPGGRTAGPGSSTLLPAGGNDARRQPNRPKAR